MAEDYEDPSILPTVLLPAGPPVIDKWIRDMLDYCAQPGSIVAGEGGDIFYLTRDNCDMFFFGMWPEAAYDYCTSMYFADDDADDDEVP